jgi:hypothetical protein
MMDAEEVEALRLIEKRGQVFSSVSPLQSGRG